MSKLDSDIVKSRDNDLMRAYRKVAPSCWTQKEAWEKTIKEKAPRYYISTAQATHILLPMINGDNRRIEKCSNPCHRRMYYSLWARVKELSQKRAYMNKPLNYIVSFAIGMEAPEFFVQPRTARLVFNRYKKKGVYGKTF
jgi:hypothetical protein